MYKKLLVLPLIIVILYICGCTNKPQKIEKFYISEEYYNSTGFINIDESEIRNLNDNSYVLFTYNNFCNLSIPCEQVFEEFMDNYKISLLSIPFENFKNTELYKTVKYAPSIIIIKEGKVVAYLDANSDEDLDKYQNVQAFTDWLSQYIYLNN